MENKYPEPGFYYHYKHNPDGTVGNFAYEVLNIGSHTEMEWNEGMFVVYRPLFPEAKVYREGKLWDIRPLDIFMEVVNEEEYKGERFIKITDPERIAELAKMRDEMYPCS
ncbi:MAG: DUF1653 domain-containing protein [Candidatus Pacebacteria bacterium]|jgi:hypothetical protein|nr:DUF1653 domain-containing protein [Candidatus Paceibacterota bacterium]